MSEQSWVNFSGGLYDGQTSPFAPASYNRLLTLVTLQANGTAPTAAGGTQFQLQLGTELQAQVYTLPQGIATPYQIPVANGGLLIPSGVVLTAVVVTGQTGGADTVVFWIESQANQTGQPDTWYVPTASDIQGSISAPEYEVFTAALLQDGQADPIPGIITDTVNEIRDAIRSGRRNNLGPIGTIPGGLAHTFSHICKWHLFSRVTAMPSFQDKSKAANDQAGDMIERIRNGEIQVVEPTTVGEVLQSGAWGSDLPITVDITAPYIGNDDIGSYPEPVTNPPTPVNPTLQPNGQ